MLYFTPEVSYFSVNKLIYSCEIIFQRIVNFAVRMIHHISEDRHSLVDQSQLSIGSRDTVPANQKPSLSQRQLHCRLLSRAAKFGPMLKLGDLLEVLSVCV